MSRRITIFLPHITAAIWKKRGMVQARIFHEWPQIVGERLAEYSWPEKITFPKEGAGTLYLRVATGAALELQHTTSTLIDRINLYFGFGAIGKILLKQGTSLRPIQIKPKPLPPLTPAEAQSIQELLSPISDPQLRDSLSRFGTTLMQRLKTL